MNRRATAGLAALAALVGTIDLETLWPHPGGARWTYDRLRIEWHPAATPRDVSSVRFDLGAVTTLPGGVVVQPLVVESGGAPAPPALARQLVLARPDVVPAAELEPSGATSGLAVLDAGALRVAADEIAAYRTDLGMRAWLYLLADPVPGRTFDLQLVPDLADSVFLHARVLDRADVSAPAGSFPGAVRVLYEIDFGWSAATGDSGQVLGRTRAWTRGEVFYAAGVGPVLARETFVPQKQIEGAPPAPAVDSTFAELRLASWSLAPARVQSAAWGRIKALYRVR